MIWFWRPESAPFHFFVQQVGKEEEEEEEEENIKKCKQ